MSAPTLSPRWVIRTTSQLEQVLSSPVDRELLLTVPSLWLADLSDDMIHVGGWSSLRWPDHGALHTDSERSRIRPWYELFQLLVWRETPFHRLALHSSVLSHWAKAGQLWLANGDLCPEQSYDYDSDDDEDEDEDESDEDEDEMDEDEDEMDEDEDEHSNEYKYLNDYEPSDLIKQASRIKVAHLTTWGSVLEDDILDRISITESFTVRGCQHSFQSRVFAHLTTNPSNFDTVTFMAREDVQVEAIRYWFMDFAWTQRGRVLFSRQPFKVFRLLLPSGVASKHRAWLQAVWAKHMPFKYSQGARLEIATYRDEYSELSQMDHDRLTFALDVDEPTKGCGYVWPIPCGVWSPSTHCLCPQVPVEGSEKRHQCGFNARNMPGDFETPSFGSVNEAALGLTWQQKEEEMDSEIALDKTLSALWQHRCPVERPDLWDTRTEEQKRLDENTDPSSMDEDYADGGYYMSSSDDDEDDESYIVKRAYRKDLTPPRAGSYQQMRDYTEPDGLLDMTSVDRKDVQDVVRAPCVRVRLPVVRR